MHLILLTDALGRVIETVVSRCQLVRFEPLPAERIAAALRAEGVPAERAKPAPGWRSATPRGPGSWPLRTGRSCGLRSSTSWPPRCSGSGARRRALAAPAGARRAAPEEAEEAAAVERDRRLETRAQGPRAARDRARSRGGGQARGRRARTEVLDLGLGLAGLAFRDLVCLAEEAPEAVLAVDHAERARRAGPRAAIRAACARRPSAARTCARRWS